MTFCALCLSLGPGKAPAAAAVGVFWPHLPVCPTQAVCRSDGVHIPGAPCPDCGAPVTWQPPPSILALFRPHLTSPLPALLSQDHLQDNSTQVRLGICSGESQTKTGPQVAQGGDAGWDSSITSHPSDGNEPTSLTSQVMGTRCRDKEKRGRSLSAAAKQVAPNFVAEPRGRQKIGRA